MIRLKRVAVVWLAAIVGLVGLELGAGARHSRRAADRGRARPVSVARSRR